MTKRIRMFINGEWEHSTSKEERDMFNPYNQEIIAIASEGGVIDARKAIEVARSAFDSGIWSDISIEERCSVVENISNLIKRNKEELAYLETLDTGKTLDESRTDMEDISNVFLYYSKLGMKNDEKVISSPIADCSSRVIKEPVGVCGLITPWNYPLLQASWKLAPALVAGNTLILKPSELTPLTSAKMFELIEEARVPDGVANLVLGSGSVVGSELSVHSDVDLISFTGGIETGRKIMQSASKNMKKIAFELGGKNPNVIFADADMETAVDQAMNAVFFHAGQVCSAGTRLIVEESAHDYFVKELTERVKRIKLGNGLDHSTQMGPLISKEHLNKVIRYVEKGKQEGATVAIGGEIPTSSDSKEGFFYLPTILTDCVSDMHVVQQEGFGPVITVEKFSK